MYERLFIFFLIVFTACNSKNQDISQDKDASLKYLIVEKRGATDTVYRELISINLVDSAYEISYKTKWGYGDKESYLEEHRLPIGQEINGGSDGFVKMLEIKNISYEGKDYKIYKFLYDDTSADDEETLYFFEPTYGFIMSKAAWWGNYDRLIDTGNETDNQIVLFLSEMILNDAEFFREY